jgi:hypothetical protein
VYGYSERIGCEVYDIASSYFGICEVYPCMVIPSGLAVTCMVTKSELIINIACFIQVLSFNFYSCGVRLLVTYL